MSRASLFDDVEDMEEESGEVAASQKDEQEEPQVEVVDPVYPLSSPVTKGGGTNRSSSPLLLP